MAASNEYRYYYRVKEVIMFMSRTLCHIIFSRYKEFGGWKVVRAYAKIGALWPMVKVILSNPFGKESYKKGYKIAAEKTGQMLCARYTPMMAERKTFYASQNLAHDKSKIVWFCWLQGIEQAPKVVRTCYDSICHYLQDREVKVVDGHNWKEYVELPDYIEDKWNKKQIPAAHFSDLLRVQLLVTYGGTWMDSTVLCTGVKPQNEEETLSYLNANLFMFQYTQRGSNQWMGISNWFITSCKNNEVLLVLRDMMFAYWRDYDCMLDYYIFHQFFSMLRSVYPEEIAAMPYGYSVRSITLGYHWGDTFDKEKWERFTSKVCFHKLSYNVRKSTEKDNRNYYHYIVDRFLQEQ